MNAAGRNALCLSIAVVLCSPISASADDAKQPSATKPKLVPLPRVAPAPSDNPTTPAKVALGKQLFFDPRLSGDNTMSCATCHAPEKGFGDGLPTAKGAGGKSLARNSQTVLNVGFFKQLFWDGRAASLEQQALVPIESADEMHEDLEALENELAAVPDYARQFRAVFASRVDREGVAKALAAYQRSLITEPSPFDRYLSGDKDALSDAAQRGLELFVGEAGCVRCHHGPLLSDGKFYRIGAGFKDKGLGGVTGKPEDNYKFRTPSLRNVAQTGPFMHDGSMETLSDVVTFYFRGIPSAAPGNLPLDVEPLSGQSFSDIDYLVAFLESLTGQTPHRLEPTGRTQE